MPPQDNCFQAKGGETRIIALKTGHNRFFYGQISTEEGRYSVDLVKKNGGHIRQFFNRQGGKNSFFFKADQTNRLKFRAETAGHYCMTINQPELEGDKNSAASAAEFLSPVLQQLAKAQFQPQQVEKFWQEVIKTGTPLVEKISDDERMITFLFRGAKNNVRLFGAPSGDHENLVRLGKTDIWYKSFQVPADTRLTYQLAVDVPDIAGSPWQKRAAIRYTAQADPLNRTPCPQNAADPYNQDSTVVLDKAPRQVFVEDLAAPQGKTESFAFFSQKLGNSHTITLYRTEGAELSGVAKNGEDKSGEGKSGEGKSGEGKSGEEKNSADLNGAQQGGADLRGTQQGGEKPVLLFMFDGAEYQTKVPLPAILDKMVKAQKIPPTIAVFVHNIDRDSRAQELPGNDDFADFLAQELLPEIEKRTGQRFLAERTVLAGSSFGGLAAMTVALRHPKHFGNVLSMSGSFWWSPKGTKIANSEYVSYQIATMEKPPLHVFLSAGLFEGGHSGGPSSLLDANRHLRDVLIAKTVPVTYREYSAGHDYAVWQGIISDGLIALFATDKPLKN